MLKRPKEFSVLAGGMLAVALSFPVQVLFMYDGMQPGFALSGMGMTPLNWFVIGASLLTAMLAFQASRLVLPALGLFLFAVTWNNWIVAEFEVNYSGMTAWAGVFLAGCIPLMLLREQARKVLLNPQLRWWRTPARKRAHVQAVVYPVLGGEIASKTFDISEGGAFISLPLGSPRSTHTDPQSKTVSVGNHCAVKLRLDQLNVLNCSARVVRKVKSAGDYPDGFAVQFVNLTPEQRRQIRTFIDQVPQLMN